MSSSHMGLPPFPLFRGGSVGHIGIRYLDLRLEVDNHELGKQYDGDSDSCPQEEQGKGDEDADEEPEAPENTNDKEDIDEDLEDERAMNDEEILDWEEFAELWDSVAE